MRLGVLLAGRKPADIRERFAQAREAGFFQCQLNLHEPGLSRAELIQIADAIEEYGVRPLAVGCYLNPLLPEAPSPMGVSIKDLETILSSMDLIGARRIVIPSGTCAENFLDNHPENSSEGALSGLRLFLSDVVRNTRARHYTLVIEPAPQHVLSSPERVRMFHATLDEPVAEHVRYVLDGVSWLNQANFPQRTEVIAEACAELGPVAGLVHLRDASLEDELDLPAPGFGMVDYAAYLDAICGSVATDVPAIARNASADQFAEVRDFLLRLSGIWQLA